MTWKFVCDLRFHEVLQNNNRRQITKWNEEIEKIEKSKLRSQTNFHGIKYINLIYIYLFIIII